MIRGLRSTSDLARGLLAASAAALVLAHAPPHSPRIHSRMMTVR